MNLFYFNFLAMEASKYYRKKLYMYYDDQQCMSTGSLAFVWRVEPRDVHRIATGIEDLSPVKTKKRERYYVFKPTGTYNPNFPSI